MAKSKGRGKGSFQRREAKIVENVKVAEKRQTKKGQKQEKEVRKKPRLARFIGHEKTERKQQIRKKLDVSRLQRALTKQEELLRNYVPPKEVVAVDPELRKKRRRRDFYDLDTSNWQLKGAARPAPIIGAEPFNPHWDGVTGQDLFETLKGEKFCAHPACKEYLQLECQLAHAMHDGAGHTKDAIPHYKRCLELDPTDAVQARHGLVRALLDQSLADKARALMDRFPADKGAVFTWSLVAIEYISWRLLSEDGSGKDVAARALAAAYAANPFIAWQLANAEVFQEVVEYADDIKDPQQGSVEEAFQYCSREMGLWADLEGAEDWLKEYLYDNQLLPPPVKGGLPGETGHMYLNMFETAIAMSAERAEEEAAAALADAAGSSDADASDEEGDAPELVAVAELGAAGRADNASSSDGDADAQGSEGSDDDDDHQDSCTH
jgi:hypothetical protein